MKVSAVLVLLVLGTWGAWASSFDDGKTAFGNQDWKAAAALLGRFLLDSPDDAQAPAAAFLRGVALYQQGDYRGSLDAFQKLERTWPLSSFGPKLPYWKGTAALAAGQWALAERELAAQTRYPDQEPFTTRALLNLALARISLGKDGPAVEALGAFTSSSHEGSLVAQAYAAWGDLDRKAGRNDSALSKYKASGLAEPGGPWDLAARTQSLDLFITLNRWTEARDLLDSSAVKFPAEADRWDTRRVLVSRALGDQITVQKTLEALWAREKDPKKKQAYAVDRARLDEESGKPEADWWLRASRGPDSTLGSGAILRYAFLQESQGLWLPAAEALAEWAEGQNPVSTAKDALARSALDRLKAGDRGGARKVWDRLITRFPQDAQAPGWLLARGRLFLDDGQSTQALADFSRLLKDFPRAAEGPEARYQTGLVYLQRQEPARAEAWFYGLVQELKTGELYQRALLARGVCFVNSGQTDLARGSLQRLIRESPDGPWTGGAWAALGRNALQARLFDEAVEAYSKAEGTQSDPQAKAAAAWALAEAQAAKGAVDEASDTYARFASVYHDQPKADEARFRRGNVYFAAKDWQKALDEWLPVVSAVTGEVWGETKEGIATALLKLGRPQDGWGQLVSLEEKQPSPDSWYRWGQEANALGQGDWAVKAFQFLLQKHPESAAAEAALPRAAGALLTGGKADEALARYADYFSKFGKDPASAPVARAAAAAAQPFPQTLEALVAASKSWNLSPEVSAEFSLAWAQSRLDSDSARAEDELEALSRTAPWTTQRSEALAILGRWAMVHEKYAEARADLEAAAGLGDDLSVFKARWALAQLTEKEGDLVNAARQRESAEKAAGPGVPVEFRIQLLKEAVSAWAKAGRPDDARRVEVRIQGLSS